MRAAAAGSGRARTSSTGRAASCEPAAGVAVFIGRSESVVDGREAFALLGTTLVRLAHVDVADRDVLAYFDSLRPVTPGDLEFKRG